MVVEWQLLLLLHFLHGRSSRVCCTSWQLAQARSGVCLNFNGIKIEG